MYEEGIILMGAGMGVVALFLTIMVLIMIATAFVIRKIESSRPDGGNNSASSGTRGSNDLVEVAVAIAAAQSHSRS